MSHNYTVVSVEGTSPKQSQYGPKQEICMTLTGGDLGGMSEGVTWFTNQNVPLPQVGTTIEGEIDRSKPQYPPKFKKSRPADFNGQASSGASRSPGGFNGGGMSPDREKKIVRQHSQQMAVSFLAATQKDGFTLQDVKDATDWFDADVLGADVPAPPALAQTFNDVLVGAGVSNDTPQF